MNQKRRTLGECLLFGVWLAAVGWNYAMKRPVNPEHKWRSRLLKLPGCLGGWSIVLLCLFGSTMGRAAEPPKTPTPTSETKQAPPAPVAIPASEVIPRGEQTLRSLQETRFQIAAESDAALNSLQKDIADFAEKSDRRWQAEVETIKRLRSLQRLNDVLRAWSLEQSQLDGWDRALSRRSQVLVNQENDISQIFDTWQATRAAGKEQGFPKLALQKVAEVLREADAVRGLIRDNMAKLLNLQSQLANRRDFLGKIRNDINKARDETGRQLLVLDSLPLWEALFHSEARDVVVLQAVQSSQRFVEDLQAFIQKYGDRILWHVVVFLAMGVSIYYLRRGLTSEAVERLGGGLCDSRP